MNDDGNTFLSLPLAPPAPLAVERAGYYLHGCYVQQKFDGKSFFCVRVRNPNLKNNPNHNQLTDFYIYFAHPVHILHVQYILNDIHHVVNC